MSGCLVWAYTSDAIHSLGVNIRASLAPTLSILWVVQPTVAHQVATCNPSLHVSPALGFDVWRRAPGPLGLHAGAKPKGVRRAPGRRRPRASTGLGFVCRGGLLVLPFEEAGQ